MRESKVRARELDREYPQGHAARGFSWLYLAAAMTAGLIGGMLANRLAAIPAAAADTPTKSISAQEFLVVDGKGKTRASLRINNDGQPVFQMFDDAGKGRIGIGFTKDGAAGFELNDKKNTERMMLGINDDGVPALRLFDDSAAPRLLAGVDEAGESAIDFYAHDGKLLRELP